MDEKVVRTAMYLAGHGSKTRPRLIELQYQRIQRYRRALLRQNETTQEAPIIYVDLRLPTFGMGSVNIDDVPAFKRLCDGVKNHEFEVVYLDLDETHPAFTPDYESSFVRDLLESSGATVLNAFTDDRGVFSRELKERCGENAREYEVTDGSDFVNFFPSLTSDIAANALRRELQVSIDGQSEQIQKINDRIEALKGSRPYSGGGIPFVEDRLSADWKRSK